MIETAFRQYGEANAKDAFGITVNVSGNLLSDESFLEFVKHGSDGAEEASDIPFARHARGEGRAAGAGSASGSQDDEGAMGRLA